MSFAGFRACLIYMRLTVYEFSFILLIHHIILLILIFVLSVTFWTLTCYKIWILLIIYCFIWNYWIIYFVTCLEVFWVLWVNSYQLAVHSRESCMRERLRTTQAAQLQLPSTCMAHRRQTTPATTKISGPWYQHQWNSLMVNRTKAPANFRFCFGTYRVWQIIS